MRFHVIGLPHTQMTRAYGTCAYTQKVRKFCDMMHSLGHYVILYAGEENEAHVAEHIPCITEADRKQLVGKGHYVNALTESAFLSFNAEAAAQMKKRMMPKDFICLIAGTAQKPLADLFPSNIAVEFGVGYGGWFSPYKVFESYAWMHTCLGSRNSNAHAINGSAWDEVIPNYLEGGEYYSPEKKGDYFLYLGRFVDRKGYQVAIDACKTAKVPLKLAGPLPLENRTYGEYVGEVHGFEKLKLLSEAKALFVPTQYIEPFGTVAIEAMACGTPVITSDWGAFTETVTPDVGIRCKVFQDYLDAMARVSYMNTCDILSYAKKFSTAKIKYQYQNYFNRVNTMWGKGWYERRAA
jgi:glycosyltransferase involved in cell wall biosynthesis